MRMSSRFVGCIFGQGSAQRWCKASETRLLLKLIDHKPAGVSRHFHMLCLVDLLNHIYEDETDVCFEEVLTQQHLKELKKGGLLKPKTAFRRFSRPLTQSGQRQKRMGQRNKGQKDFIKVDPHWRNPTGEWAPNSPDWNVMDYFAWPYLQSKACTAPHFSIANLKASLIEQKLNENFNLDVINENELVPGNFLKKVDFFLPDLSNMSDIVPPSCSVTPTPREDNMLLPPPLPSVQKERATKRRKPIDSPTELLVDNNSRSSRSSTPGSIKRLRH